MDLTPHNLKKQSFTIFYQKFALPLKKFLIKKMGNNEAAEEIFSQTVLAAWRGFNTFEYKSTFFTWICRIGLNKIADYYRFQINERSKIVAPLLSTIANIEDNSLKPEEKLALEELRASIRECLNLLPAEKKQLLYLRYWKELTLKEIAEVLNTTERAVEGKIYRAKLEFKEVLKNKHPELVAAGN